MNSALRNFVKTTSLVLLAQNAVGIKCVTQLTTSETDWEIKECSTYCLISFAKSTLYPEFTQPNPICLGAGCAVLDSDGNLDVSKTVFGTEEFPVDGKIEVYTCTNKTFTEYPTGLEVDYSSGEPCNMFRDYKAETQVCQYLADPVVELNVDVGFFQRHKFLFILGICLVAGIVFLILVFVLYKKHHAKSNASKSIEPGQNDPESPPPSPYLGRDMSSSSLFSDDGPPNLPSHLAPGSAAYERYHQALTTIYRDAGVDTDRVDTVLQQYLSRPNGLELLNKKLKQKFGKQLKKFVAANPLSPNQQVSTQSQSFN